jgi:hypothetical protein
VRIGECCENDLLKKMRMQASSVSSESIERVVAADTRFKNVHVALLI